MRKPVLDLLRDPEGEARLSAPTRPGQDDRAQWIEPDLRCGRRQLIAVVGIAHGISHDRFVGLAYAADRLAEIIHRRLAAALEAVEVERDRLDPAVVLGGVERFDQLAQAVLPYAVAPGELGEFDLRRLLDHGSPEIQREHAVPDRCRPRCQHGIEHGEEQKHQDQDESVLDSDQQLPDCANELHAIFLGGIAST